MMYIHDVANGKKSELPYNVMPQFMVVASFVGASIVNVIKQEKERSIDNIFNHCSKY